MDVDFVCPLIKRPEIISMTSAYRSFPLRSDRFNLQRKIAQLIEQLTNESIQGGGGIGSNPCVVHHYFSHLIL